VITAAFGLAYNQVMAGVVKRLYAGQTVTEKEMVALMKQSFREQMKKGPDLLKQGEPSGESPKNEY
jgi:hypothetical protein